MTEKKLLTDLLAKMLFKAVKEAGGAQHAVFHFDEDNSVEVDLAAGTAKHIRELH